VSHAIFIKSYLGLVKERMRNTLQLLCCGVLCPKSRLSSTKLAWHRIETAEPTQTGISQLKLFRGPNEDYIVTHATYYDADATTAVSEPY